MALFFLTVEFALFGALMFTLGMSASSYIVSMLLKRNIRKSSGSSTDENAVTRDDIRSELMRDPFATDLMCNDDTSDDVVRYLYLEAERRVKLRKQGILGDHENDLFSPPHHNHD